MGLRGNAIATDVPLLIVLLCSPTNAAGRKPSLPASGIKIASKPAVSAARAAAGTSRKLRVDRPVSSFIIFRSRVDFWTSGRNRNKAGTELERARSAPTRASANHFERAARVVADQSVHAHLEQIRHLGFFVHRPDVHFDSETVREFDTLARDQLPVLVEVRDLDRVRRSARRS